MVTTPERDEADKPGLIDVMGEILVAQPLKR
ncbi:hypothetical protein SEENP078_13635 [Salmonella enterica subsp. enterica serovar Newport str. RI_10P078]|nr:hypothetical protein SEENP078_13635 [Salmonella enterica subsp. enterica serovar Newport str. RI_10P078]ESC57211.1 hypothetical protein SEEN4900_04705 [Salmonella enterica subsp. enterica serovar Newport str. WA_14900]